jgi:hypothetical protein
MPRRVQLLFAALRKRQAGGTWAEAKAWVQQRVRAMDGDGRDQLRDDDPEPDGALEALV